MEIIGRAVGKAFGINPEELKGKARSLELIRARGVFCRAAKGYGYRGAEIGEYLKRDPGAVSKYMRRGEELVEERGKVAEIIGG